jgi:hypothetical protein
LQCGECRIKYKTLYKYLSDLGISKKRRLCRGLGYTEINQFLELSSSSDEGVETAKISAIFGIH